jgi:hypothetical protein
VCVIFTGDEAAVKALAEGIKTDTSSALFRHEIAFVMGQLQHRAAIPALKVVCGLSSLLFLLLSLPSLVFL